MAASSTLYRLGLTGTCSVSELSSCLFDSLYLSVMLWAKIYAWKKCFSVLSRPVSLISSNCGRHWSTLSALQAGQKIRIRYSTRRVMSNIAPNVLTVFKMAAREIPAKIAKHVYYSPLVQVLNSKFKWCNSYQSYESWNKGYHLCDSFKWWMWYVSVK